MNLWLPENISSVGRQVDSIFYVILWITGVVFVAVELTLVAFLILYRKRDKPKVAYTHGSTTVEVVWTVIPAILLVFLAFLSQDLWSQIRNPKRWPAETLTIRVQAERWQWNITYPGLDNAFGTGDDIETIGELHLPVATPVRVMITSKDIIHSFFIPAFRIKQDAVPGLHIPVGLQAEKTGHYDLMCAEFCGDEHYQMRGAVTIESPEEFLAWQKSQKEESW